MNEHSIQKNIYIPDARKYFICCTEHIAFKKYIIANNDNKEKISVKIVASQFYIKTSSKRT